MWPGLSAVPALLAAAWRSRRPASGMVLPDLHGAHTALYEHTESYTDAIIFTILVRGVMSAVFLCPTRLTTNNDQITTCCEATYPKTNSL